jgi:hypothetical protein
MQILPTYFYYQEKRGKRNYARHPPGQLDVVRLARGKLDCWLKNGSQTKPRKLILADEMLPYWSDSERLSKIEWLRGLRKAGFELYLWQNNCIVPLDEILLWAVHPMGDLSLTSLTPAYPEEVYSVGAKSGLTPLNSLILNDDIMRMLLEDKAAAVLAMEAMEAMDGEFGDSLESITWSKEHGITKFGVNDLNCTVDLLVEILKIPRLSCLNFEDLAGKSSENLMHSFQAIDGATLEHLSSFTYSSTIFNKVDMSDFFYSLSKTAPNLVELEISHKTHKPIALEPLEYLQYATINCSQSWQPINELMEKAPHLKGIKISTPGEHFDELCIPNHSELELMSIDTRDLTARDLLTILTQCQHLKILQFSSITTIPVDFILAHHRTARFPNITTIDLEDNLIGVSLLCGLMDMFPNLHTVNLVGCKALDTRRYLFEPGPPKPGFRYPHVLNPIFGKQKAPVPIQAARRPLKRREDRPPHVDTDTTQHPDATFDVKKIFFAPEGKADPAVNYYRDSLATEATLSRTLPVHFKLSHDTTRDYVDCAGEMLQMSHDVYSLIKETQYYGRETFSLTRAWQAVPSLSPTDKISHYHLSPVDDAVEIAYSPKDNQYFIRSSLEETREITLDFLVSQEVNLTPQALPLEVQHLIRKYEQFKSGPLELPPELSEQGFVDAMSTQKVGACRHRAVAFFLEMKQKLPQIPVRIVSNTCHMFVEVLHECHWITCDLGGYPAHLQVDNSSAPTATAREVESVEMAYVNPLKEAYAREFETWKVGTPESVPEHHYFQKLIKKTHKTQLIECETHDLLTLALKLEHEAASISKPVIYLHSPDDMVCSAPYIQRSGLDGTLCKSEQGGGPLHDLLQQYRHQDPLIIVNYSTFEPNDIVRLNGLLDKDAHADGSLLPPRAMVIGLIDPKAPTSYKGADFYSRFENKEASPFKNMAPMQSPLREIPAALVHENTKIIHLFHAADWQERLLGRWVLHQGTLKFEPGELLEALAQGQSIILQNPPEDEAFTLFWQQALLRGYMDYEGIRTPFSQEQLLYTGEGYGWPELLKPVDVVEAISGPLYPLNSTTLSSFLSNYTLLDGHAFTKTEGILGTHATGILPVYVTHALSLDEWGQFLNACLAYPELQIALSVAPGIALPPEWGIDTPDPLDLPEGTGYTRCYKTNDTDALIQEFEAEGPWMVIDVTELSIQDLLVRLDVKMNDLVYRFSETDKVLLKALKTNQRVILTGDFSNELLEALAPFLIQRLQDTRKDIGELILIAEKDIPYLPTRGYLVEMDSKRELLIQEGFSEALIDALREEDPVLYPKLGLIELKTRLRYLQRHPGTPTSLAWHGLERLAQPPQFEKFSPLDSKAKAQSFVDARHRLVDDVLATEPYVFLAGLTGVGKSSFVERAYQSNATRTLYPGESLETLKQWALHPEDGTSKILFIDEANLSSTHWCLFEGLFHKPPSVLIDGDYYPLSRDHRVIFAGNPLSYGDERETPALFQRHANTVVFEPLSAAFIYEHVLKPVFEGSSLKIAVIEEVSSIYFELYAYLTSLSKTEVLISPREMQMLALFTLNVAQQNPMASDDAILSSARAHVYQLGKTLIPDEHDDAFQVFNEKSHANHAFDLHFDKKNRNFLFTESRREMLACFHDYLTIREMRRERPGLNQAQKHGGLGGLIIEGDPGIGKSELVVHWLVSQGFKEGRLSQAHPPPKVFYKIPVSMEIEEKKAYLIKAFHEGAVVIIDEINASPMMEQLLNRLLMGKDLNGRPPENPGFLLVGTQNPAKMGGRLTASPALKRRLQTFGLPAYPPVEMEMILRQKGVPEASIVPMVQAFVEKSKQAEREHLTPAPSFRDLMRLADSVIESRARAQYKVGYESTLRALQQQDFRQALAKLTSSGAGVTTQTAFKK